VSGATWRRRTAVLVVGLVGLGGLTACGEGDAIDRELRAALGELEAQSRTFTYTETSEDLEDLTVRGLIEDDFRFTAQVVVDGEPLLEQVVFDDTLAVRFLSATAGDGLVLDPSAADEPTDLDGATVEAVLASRRWVLDPTGAPPASASATDFEGVGLDPVRDARTVVAYVEAATDQAAAVVRFNADSLDYKPSEDPFPTPEEGSEVVRYDVVAPFLPNPSAGGAGGVVLPAARNFRKLSVYVEDGKVLRITERIAADGDLGDRLEDYLRVGFEETAPEQLGRFDASLDQAGDEGRGTVLLSFLNGFLAAVGEDPIRARTMTVEFGDQGQDIAVDLPSPAVNGDLALLLPPPDEVEAREGTGPDPADG